MPITRNFTLYLNAGISVAPTVHVNQYDRGEQWVFTLLDDKGQKYTPISGALIGVKADGNAIAGVTGTVGSNGDVYITETQQMTAAAGKAIFELTIDGMTHGTANFIVQVEKKPTDDAVLSESDLSIIQQGIDSVTPAAINETVSEYLAEHMTNPPIDPTLTVRNAAADAKVTGDNITDLKNAVNNSYFGLIVPKIISGKYINATTGAYISSANSKATDYVPCIPGEIVIINAVSASSYGAWYDSNKERVASLSINAGLNYIVTPSNAYFFATSTRDASVENLQIYSKIGTDLKLLTESVSEFGSEKAHAVGTADVVSGNLFDATLATEGYFLNGTSGTPTANPAYGYSDYIPISGDQYLYSENIASNAIYFYDENKVLLSPANRVIQNYALASTWPFNAKYCRFNFNISVIDSIAFRTSLNTGYYISKEQILESYNIHVGSTQDYTTLKSAVDYINRIAKGDIEYNILLDEGTYDALDGFDLSSQSSTFMGIVLPNHTNIIGQGNPANTIISVDGTNFPSNITNNEVSVLNMYRNHKISNVTIQSKNIRYGVHADDSYRATNPVSDAVMEFENVHFLNLAKTVTGTASYCIGIGAKKGEHFKFKNCWIENQDTTYCAFLAHNGTTAEKPVVYDFDGCKFTNNGSYGVRFTTTAFNIIDIVNFKGCKTNKNVILDKGGSNTNTNTGYKFFGHGNSGFSFSVNGIVLKDSDTEMML